MALAVAVQQYRSMFERQGGPTPAAMTSCRDLATLLASQGDLLMFPGTKAGQTAAVFHALARGLALLSFVPGGVTFLGDHWPCPKE